MARIIKNRKNVLYMATISNDTKEKPTIGMLLDTEHLYGNSESRLGPILMSLCIGGAPILFYVYFSLFKVIPVWIFAPIEIVIIIRVVMIIQGREPYRKKMFRRTLHDEYTSTDDLINLKTIHPDGCIEYTNGTICYLVCSFNGTTEDEMTKTYEVRKLLEMMLSDYVFDIYIHNITVSPELREYYNRAARFDKNDSARNFIGIIDHMLDLVSNNSMLQMTVFAVKGRRSDWKEMKHTLDIACKSKVAQCYKTIYVAQHPEEINDIMNRDIDTIVDIPALLRKKYKTGEYASSQVLAYDLPDDEVVVQGEVRQDPVIPKAKSSSFHVLYKEE